MADECKCEECEEWPLSMADMMTNLLCFFILLVSIASFDESKFEAASQAMAESFGGEASRATTTEQVIFELEQQQSLEAIYEAMRALFRPEEKILELDETASHLSVTLSGWQIFYKNTAKYTKKAEYILERIAIVTDKIPFPIIIEGHTDDSDPVNDFASNWELSIARSSAIARYLIDNGLPSNKVQIVGRSDRVPLESNKTRNGKRKNNRIVLLISPFVKIEKTKA